MIPQYYQIPLFICEKIVFLRFLLFASVGIWLNLYKFSMIGIEVISFIVIILTILIAFSSGYLTSLIYINGSKFVENRMKEKANSYISFFLMSGLFFGTLFSASVSRNLL